MMAHFHFKSLLDSLYARARDWSPAQFIEPQSARTRQVDGLRSEARVRQHVMTIDEPLDFDGSDLAPNPAEVLLAALGASLEVTTRVFADYYEIPVRSIAVSLDAELDVHGFLDLDATTRSGFRVVRATIMLDSDASDDALASLMRRVERSCPVLDTVRSPTPVQLTLARVPAPS